MKYLLLSATVFLTTVAYSQKTNHLKNIKYLLSLHTKNDLNAPRHNKIVAFTNYYEYLGINMSLLPDILAKKYFSPLSIYIPGPEHSIFTTFDNVAQFEQTNSKITKIDFYSTWYEDVNNNRTDSGVYFHTPASKALIDEFIQVLSKNGWQFKDSLNKISTESLIFKHHDIELTVVFETLADVRGKSPFWKLDAPDIRWPEDHIPDMKRFIHFIIRKL